MSDSIVNILNSMQRHAKAIQRLTPCCDCPLEYDPYGTGDSDYAVRNCQREDCCVFDEINEDEDEEEEE